MARRASVLGLVLLLAGLASCSDSDSREAKFVGPQGGRASLGDFRTDWPAGAVSDVYIVRLRRTDLDVVPPIGVTEWVSPSYRISLDSLSTLVEPPETATLPLTVSLPIPGGLTGEEQSRLVWLGSQDGIDFTLLRTVLREERVEAATTNLGVVGLGLRAAGGGT